MSIETLLRDARFALRSLTRARVFALVAVASLSVGIGANTAVFSLVSGLLFSKPDLPASRELVEIHRFLPDGSHNAVSQHDLEDIREGAAAVLAGLSAYLPFTGQVGGTDGPGTVVLGELVNAEYFRTLGVEMAVGRSFLAEEDRVPLAAPVVVLGHRFWQTAFQGDRRVVGRTVRLNGREYSVVGVAPERFTSHTGGLRIDVWAPMMMHDHLSPFQPEWDNLFAVARLAPRTPSATFAGILAAVADRQDGPRGRSDRRWRYAATSFDDILFSPSFDGVLRAIALLLLVVVGLVLIVTCSNLAGFLLARATDRRKEVAIRMATGASRGMVVRQMLIEALLLSLLGGTGGVVVSRWLVTGLMSTHLPLPIPLNLDVPLDWRVFAYTAAASLGAGVFFGLLPALRGTRLAVAPTLREESGGSSGGGARVRSALIAGQLALSVLLLVSAGLFIRSMRAALRVDPGFSTAPAGLLTVDLRGSGYQPGQYALAHRRILDALTRVPGVERITVADRIPMTIGNSGATIEVPGFVDGRGGNRFRVESSRVDHAFFSVLGIPLPDGEPFREYAGGEAPRVAILNRVAAERLWPGASAVGRSVSLGDDVLTIVGVAATARDRGLAEAPRPMLYTPLLPDLPSSITFVARSGQPAPRLADEMRRAALGTDPRLFVVESRTLDEHLGVMYFLPRAAAWMLTGIAALAVALGCIGLFGAVSHAVARRSRELAIRLALGATPGEVVGLVVRSQMTVAATGTAVGMALALAAGRFLGRFLVGGRWFDAAVYVAIPLLLVGVALLASWIPARRAGRLDPIAAMRAE